MTDDRCMTLLNRGKAAEFLSMSISSFDTARKKPNFPAPVIMLNSSKWIQSDLEQYIEDSKVTEVSE
jgi:predicted DNA-binding transcriptional regulator AlpA